MSFALQTISEDEFQAFQHLIYTETGIALNDSKRCLLSSRLAKRLRALQLNDYLMARYRGPAPQPVELYVAWYDSQRAGRSVHSPRTCLPGGGWQINEFDQVEVPGVAVDGEGLRVNGALIAMGPNRQLVYYWFQQRGRVMTN